MTEAQRIAAWLRKEALTAHSLAQYCRSGNAGRTLQRKCQMLRDYALRIERGEHMETNDGE